MKYHDLIEKMNHMDSSLKGLIKLSKMKPNVVTNKAGRLDIKFDFIKFDLNAPNAVDTMNLIEIIKCENNFATAIELFCRGCILVEGPKIFRPQADNFEALENMDVNVPLKEFKLPFPTIIIELPENYTQNRLVKNPLPGPREWNTFVSGTVHGPSMVIIHQHEDIVLLTVFLTSSDAYSTALWRYTEGDNIIEDLLDALQTKDSYNKSLPILPEEVEMFFKTVRAALNCCLIINEIGFRKLGPQNPSYYARLQRRIDNKHISVEKRLSNQSLLEKHPIIYEFDQRVKLYRSETMRSYGDGHSGLTVSTHWRRGHYRQQHYGPHNSLTKRVFIPAVLVNKHLFRGEDGNTKVTYQL